MIAFEGNKAETAQLAPWALVLTGLMSAYVCVLLSYLCIFYETSGRLSAVIVVLVLSPVGHGRTRTCLDQLVTLVML